MSWILEGKTWEGLEEWRVIGVVGCNSHVGVSQRNKSILTKT